MDNIFNKRIKFGKNLRKIFPLIFSNERMNHSKQKKKEYKKFTKGSIFRPIFFPFFASLFDRLGARSLNVANASMVDWNEHSWQVRTMPETVKRSSMGIDN